MLLGSTLSFFLGSGQNLGFCLGVLYGRIVRVYLVESILDSHHAWMGTRTFICVHSLQSKVWRLPRFLLVILLMAHDSRTSYELLLFLVFYNIT